MEKPKKEGQTTVLPPIRVSPERKARYEAAAERRGKTLSGWIKAVLDRASKR